MNRKAPHVGSRRAALPVAMLVVLLLGGRLAVARQCPGPQPEVEPNDTAATATPLTTAFSEWLFFGAPGAISPAGDVDYFQIRVGAGDRLWLLVDTGGAQLPGANSRDSVLEVVGPDGSTVLELDDDDGTGNGTGWVISSLEASLVAGFVVPSTATYYVRVRAKNPGDVIAPYVLMVGVSWSAAIAEIEPNDTLATSHLLFGSEPVLGALSSGADVDWYTCDLLDSGVPFVVVDGDPERDGSWTDVMLDFALYGPSFPQVDSSSGSGSPAPPAEGVVLPATGSVRVSGPAAGSYMLIAPYSNRNRCQALGSWEVESSMVLSQHLRQSLVEPIDLLCKVVVFQPPADAFSYPPADDIGILLQYRSQRGPFLTPPFHTKGDNQSSPGSGFAIPSP